MDLPDVRGVPSGAEQSAPASPDVAASQTRDGTVHEDPVDRQEPVDNRSDLRSPVLYVRAARVLAAAAMLWLLLPETGMDEDTLEALLDLCRDLVLASV